MKIIVNDCVEAMRAMEENSVDAIVTDPPYGLEFMGKDWDKLSAPDATTLADPAEAGGFQDGAGGNPYSRGRVRHGKQASSMAMVEWHENWAREALRVLRPGGHLLVFGGSRTYHSMAMGVELAGFEIRDQIQWVYGQGFPKSMNVGKAIDKSCKALFDRDVDPRQWDGWGTALKPAHEPIVMARKPFKGSVASNVLEHGTGAINVDGCRVALAEDEDVDKLNARSGGKRGFASEYVGGDDHPLPPGADLSKGRWPANFIHDGSDEATEGLGAAARFFYIAKPGKKEKMASVSCGCSELKGTPWVREALSRNEPMVFTSPVRGTSEDSSTEGSSSSTDTYGSPSTDPSQTATSCTTSTETSKTTELRTSSSSPELTTSESTQGANCGTGNGGSPAVSVENSSLSSPNTGISAKNSGLSTAVVVPATSAASYRTKSCADCGQNLRTESHPTQKPVALMAYLCRLVTPPGGTVLDPFLGSGTTGVAAIQEGFDFIGIEREAEYAAIAEARINNARGTSD